jgi:peroxiredoxin
MADAALCFGIPDIALPRVGGGEINPGAFVGHELIVFFCPADPAAAAEEVEAFRQRAEDFADGGAWVIGVLTDAIAEAHGTAPAGPQVALARDPDGAGWASFQALLEPVERTAEVQGGTFFFARGGCLAGAWPGCGHAEDALNAVHVRR